MGVCSPGNLAMYFYCLQDLKASTEKLQMICLEAYRLHGIVTGARFNGVGTVTYMLHITYHVLYIAICVPYRLVQRYDTFIKVFGYCCRVCAAHEA